MNIFTAIWHYIESVFKGLAGQALQSAKDFVVNFIKTDLGQDALAAVEYAETLANASGPDKQAAARQHLIDLLKQSGKDVANFATSELNWFIETALQALKAGITSATASTGSDNNATPTA